MNTIPNGGLFYKNSNSASLEVFRVKNSCQNLIANKMTFQVIKNIQFEFEMPQTHPNT